MTDKLEGILVLITALSISLFFFAYPSRFNQLIQWMFRVGKELPILSVFWQTKKPEQWAARPIFIRLYFLPFIIMMGWILYDMTIDK
jgi:hypothetical protein